MAYSSSWRVSTCSTWRAERAGLLLLTLLLAMAVGPARAKAPALPTIWLSDLAGARAPLDSLLAGRATLVLFWSTPCQACLEKLRAVEAFVAARAEQDLGLLMVNVDAPRNKNLIAPFLHRFGFQAPSYIDPDREAFRKLGGREAPYLVFVSAEREILHRSGALDRRDLEQIAAQLEATMPGGEGHE